MRPRYQYGEGVRVLRNIRNDGTFPGQATGTLLVPRGSLGFVRDVGTFLQDQLIYSVHFLEAGRVVGCREEELQPAEDPWSPSRFEFREQVAARVRLALQGEILVEPGDAGEVVKVIANAAGGFVYHVYFSKSGKMLQVPEGALEAVPVATPAGESPVAANPPGGVP